MEQVPSSSVTVSEKDGNWLLLLQRMIGTFSTDKLYQADQGFLERGEDTTICCQDTELLDTCVIQIVVSLQNGLKEKGKTYQINGFSPELEKTFSLAGLNGYFSYDGTVRLSKKRSLGEKSIWIGRKK